MRRFNLSWPYQSTNWTRKVSALSHIHLQTVKAKAVKTWQDPWISQVQITDWAIQSLVSCSPDGLIRHQLEHRTGGRVRAWSWSRGSDGGRDERHVVVVENALDFTSLKRRRVFLACHLDCSLPDLNKVKMKTFFIWQSKQQMHW